MGKQVGTSTPRSRGAYGSTRGKERQARRTRVRMENPRVRNALADAAADRHALDQLIAQQEADAAKRAVTVTTTSTARGTTSVLVLKPSKARPDTSHVPEADARGEKGWTLGQARTMLRDGYRVDRVIATTGWGRDWLADLLGPDGIHADHHQ